MGMTAVRFGDEFCSPLHRFLINNAGFESNPRGGEGGGLKLSKMKFESHAIGLRLQGRIFE